MAETGRHHPSRVGRTPRIPAELRKRPFTLAEARAAGVTPRCLNGRSWRRLGAALYCWTGWRGDRWQLISAWNRTLPHDAIFAGATAAWLWGLDIKPDDPIEVILPLASGLRSRDGLNVRHGSVEATEIAQVRGLRATVLARTLRDLCARLPKVEALSAIDMAINAQQVDAPALIEYATSVKGRPGAASLLALVPLAAPAESPMETRLRWLLLQAGLPRPEVQTDLRDEDGRFVGRADLFYPAARLVIEYDGANHRDRLVDDNRRQNLILNAGFSLLRFTASDLDRPEVVLSQVERALAAPGRPARRRG